MFVGRPNAGAYQQQVTAGAPTEYRLWGTSTEGSGPWSDEVSIIFGTKFRVSAAGQVIGLMWQRVSGDTGCDAIAVFNTAGTNLSGTTTVTGQTASGWQRMDFGSPLSISASTLYVAVGKFPTGTYYEGATYFNAARTVGPITAVAYTESNNGLSLPSSSMVLPSEYWGPISYFIDLVFVAS